MKKNLIQFTLAMFIGLIALNFSASKIFAFTLNNNVEAKFQGDFVSVNFNSTSTCENTGRTVEQIRAFIDLALKKFWNSVSTSSLDIRPGSLVDKGALFETDILCVGGITSPCDPNPSMSVDDGILVVCNNNASNFGGSDSSSGSIVGSTLTNNIDQDKLKGAVVALNNRSNSMLSLVSDDTFVAILAHEIGHAFGLGHSPHKENLMYYSTVPTRDELGWDDIDAVTYLYPKEDLFFGIDGCDIIDSRSQAPGGTDQQLKVYHLGIDESTDGTRPTRHSFLLALALGLCIFPLGLIFRALILPHP